MARCCCCRCCCCCWTIIQFLIRHQQTQHKATTHKHTILSLSVWYIRDNYRRTISVNNLQPIETLESQSFLHLHLLPSLQGKGKWDDHYRQKERERDHLFASVHASFIHSFTVTMTLAVVLWSFNWLYCQHMIPVVGGIHAKT